MKYSVYIALENYVTQFRLTYSFLTNRFSILYVAGVDFHTRQSARWIWGV